MSNFTFDFYDGLALGEGENAERQKTVTLRDLSAAEIFRAEDQSEQPTRTADGWELIVSPAKLSRELIRLSVVSIGQIDGLSIRTMGMLSSRDLQLLYAKHEEFSGLQDALLSKRLEEAKKLGKP
ncbi:phage tail assembly protein [Ignatzschineria rhizosphaerae]|uniref:Phage tail assembly protein n=1 Tax=Ignatzschineria rhizosphaerae TaxID=2923279 RepID=A0ABY3X1A7_9GAMM|nr:phage tail assembly protein [Ignatzschineria rhizosphaerae]UNM95665.1 phage tail assembly protein [Ignatzschineria rhizosphaerae]